MAVKFKVGDKVRIISNTSSHGYRIGSIVAIREIVNNSYYRGSFQYTTGGCAFTDRECEAYHDAIKLKIKQL